MKKKSKGKKSLKVQPAPVLVRMFFFLGGGGVRTRSDSIGHARGFFLCQIWLERACESDALDLSGRVAQPGQIKTNTRHVPGPVAGIAKLPPVTRRPTRGATEQYSGEPAQQMLSTRAVARSTTKRQHYTCPNTHRPRNSKADLRFLRCYIAKEGGRIQSGQSSFPFRFAMIAYEPRTAKLSPVTCMRGATALCFQPLLFPHVWWRELKDTITAWFFRKRRRTDRQHEVPSV